MFPQPEDQEGYEYPDDGLLQAYGVVGNDEIRQPQTLDIHGEKALLVVKNGLATGTTLGRVNGLESFTRTYTEYGVEHTSIEIAILAYDRKHGPFSTKGDSGAIILDRAGRIVALLTGGAGTADEVDITYGTPYWWLEEQIKTAIPGSCVSFDQLLSESAKFLVIISHGLSFWLYPPCPPGPPFFFYPQRLLVPLFSQITRAICNEWDVFYNP